MTVRDLFSCINTDTPRIIIYDSNDNVIWQKHSNKLIVKMPHWDKDVAWIYKADSTEIALKLEREETE